MQAIILAAGKGTRMRSETPKVLHRLMGQSMIDYVLQNLKSTGVKKPLVVVGAGADQLKKHLGKNASTVLQKQQNGTGHAVAVTKSSFKNQQGHVIIWPGDMPLIELKTLKSLIRKHVSAKADVSVLSAKRKDSYGYGRILRSGKKCLGIREEADATELERLIREVNTGVYVFKLSALWRALKKVQPKNRQKEYYLTDTIEILVRENAKVQALCLASEGEGLGINSRQELAQATQVLNDRSISDLQNKGVTFVNPAQTYVEPGVIVGKDTTIYPWTYIETGVKIGAGCEIGPFAKIRRGTRVGNCSVVGSFVEINRTQLGNGVAVKHLSYLGDANVGDGSNIGAGTITANFDGKQKNVTKIGKRVLVGSNTVFVAPVSMGDEARTGAGSVVPAKHQICKGEIVAGVPAKTLSKTKK